jgi:hypothetical protein
VNRTALSLLFSRAGHISVRLRSGGTIAWGPLGHPRGAHWATRRAKETHFKRTNDVWTEAGKQRLRPGASGVIDMRARVHGLARRSPSGGG